MYINDVSCLSYCPLPNQCAKRHPIYKTGSLRIICNERNIMWNRGYNTQVLLLYNKVFLSTINTFLSNPEHLCLPIFDSSVECTCFLVLIFILKPELKIFVFKCQHVIQLMYFQLTSRPRKHMHLEFPY